MTSPALAQTLRESASAAAREAALTQTIRGPMSPALKWTGLALLVGGAGVIAGGIAKDNGCVDEEFAGFPIVDRDCKDQAKGLQVLGGLVAGVGGGLLLIGALKRDVCRAVHHGDPAWRCARAPPTVILGKRRRVMTRRHSFLVIVASAFALISQAHAASEAQQTSHAITLYIFTKDDPAGFVDAMSKERAKAVLEVRKRLAKEKGILLVETPDQAQVVFEIPRAAIVPVSERRSVTDVLVGRGRAQEIPT